MSDNAPKSPPGRQMLAQLPSGEICQYREKPWFSATFSGVQLGIVLRLHGESAAADCARLARDIGEIEFTLSNMFVAEISAQARAQDAGGCCEIEIEALLIEA